MRKLSGVLRRAARLLRHGPDRILHAQRRRRAREQLRGMVSTPEAVLFICYGNICRSPYAAEVFRRSLSERTRDRVLIRSAGLYGHGRASPDRAIEVARRLGVDLTGHRSTLLNPGLVARSGLVVVMSREQERVIRMRYRVDPRRILILGDLDPLPIETRTIVDPYGCAEGVFEASYTRIDRCVGELVRALFPAPDTTSRGSPRNLAIRSA